MAENATPGSRGHAALGYWSCSLLPDTPSARGCIQPVGLLTDGSSPCIPPSQDRSQWSSDAGLTAYSCGGSSIFSRQSLCFGFPVISSRKPALLANRGLPLRQEGMGRNGFSQARHRFGLRFYALCSNPVPAAPPQANAETRIAMG